MNDRDPDETRTFAAVDEKRSLVERVRRIGGQSGKRLAGAIGRRLDRIADATRQQMMELLDSPEQIQSLQKILATVANWSLRRGFRADPNAELLFEFVDWLDGRHRRATIMALLLQSELYRDPALIEALVQLSRQLAPWPGQISPDEVWDAPDIERFKRQCGTRLLDLLVELAALEASERPEDNSTPGRIDYFESAPIPRRFRRLAAMTQGRLLITRDTAPGERKLFGRLIDRIRPETDGKEGQLTPFIPGVGDQTLYFLVLSTTFFLQGYLLRNLIEALPDLASALHDELEGEDLIDLE